ncbi:HXXXD-type acyl-transferase family protein [Euphorbia peplus]|nr:HXXXD-type acyl-transferase family protein [Euphorbia peplus]
MATHPNNNNNEHKHKNTPFVVSKKQVEIIKPSKQTPSQILSFSSIDNDQVLELICQTLYVYPSNPPPHHHLQSNSNPVTVIKDAISKVLVHFYPLAGKLKRDSRDRRLYLTCNGDGVPFSEATVDCDLASVNYLDGVDVEIARNFIFDVELKSEIGYHPLMFQVTKFSCGGFTIGMGLSHSVCDGFGAAQFFTAMAELASGKTEPSVKPVWERERLEVSKATNTNTNTNTTNHDVQLPFKFDVDELAKSPYLPTNEIVHQCFNVTSESIKKLKESLVKEFASASASASLVKECESPVKECESESKSESQVKLSFTTIEALGAYIWRSRFRALKLNPDGKTSFFLATGIRNRLNPPLPKGYYGNAFVSSTSTLPGKDLNEVKLSETAKLIKESKRASCSESYIWSELKNREKLIELNVKIEGGNGANMVLTDWRQLGLMEEVDFGWGGAVNIIPVPWEMFGYVDLCFLIPPCNLDASMKGGVRVLVSLPKDAMPKFKEEMDALRSGTI